MEESKSKLILGSERYVHCLSSVENIWILFYFIASSCLSVDISLFPHPWPLDVPSSLSLVYEHLTSSHRVLLHTGSSETSWKKNVLPSPESLASAWCSVSYFFLSECPQTGLHQLNQKPLPKQSWRHAVPLQCPGAVPGQVCCSVSVLFSCVNTHWFHCISPNRTTAQVCGQDAVPALPSQCGGHGQSWEDLLLLTLSQDWVLHFCREDGARPHAAAAWGDRLLYNVQPLKVFIYICSEIKQSNKKKENLRIWDQMIKSGSSSWFNLQL